MKEQSEHPDPIELAQFLTERRDGKIPPSVEAWVQASDHNEATFDALKQAWEMRESSRISSAEAMVALDRLRERLGEDRAGKLPFHQFPRISSRVAAMIAALVITVGTMLFVTVDDLRGRFLNSSSLQEYSTAIGQQIQIELQDGTTAWLAPGTTLSYTNRNSRSPRLVTLNGEAIFTVTHKEASPFIVRTGKVESRVLGTTFGVRYYNEDTSVRIVINDGKVAVDSLVLTHGDIAWVAASGNAPMVRHNQQVSSFLNWRDGQLNFVATRFDEVLPVLSKWYDLEFVLSDPALASHELNATFETSKITAEDLDFISTTLGVRYLRIGRTVTFYSEEQ